MPIITMKELLEAGAHFGHRKSAWNPKMKPYIYQRRENMHIIDLTKTVKLLDEAYSFVRDLGSEGKQILFVGTKPQAKKCIQEEADRCGCPYVNNRWLGGFLTNFPTIKKRIERLSHLEREEKEGLWEKLSKKEEISLRKELEKLGKNLGGVKNVDTLPNCLFVTDVRIENTAVKEAVKLKIPVIGMIDSNVDPEEIGYPIPANDDAIKSIKLITGKIADAVVEGKDIFEKRKLIEEKKKLEEAETEKAEDKAAEPEEKEEKEEISEQVKTAEVSKKISRVVKSKKSESEINENKEEEDKNINKEGS
ncbi:30S ribosomal protein S2 [Candidatus Aerophobetes bacterium]|nr:30S ribosomal protein S2 [Candidatus Aerophobetes bacterium]